MRLLPQGPGPPVHLQGPSAPARHRAPSELPAKVWLAGRVGTARPEDFFWNSSGIPGRAQSLHHLSEDEKKQGLRGGISWGRWGSEWRPLGQLWGKPSKTCRLVPTPVSSARGRGPQQGQAGEPGLSSGTSGKNRQYQL